MLKHLFILVAVIWAAPSYAQDKAASAFGAREGIEYVSLSPDGKKVAYIVPTTGQGSRLLTVDLAKGGKPTAALAASGDPERLSHCEWVSNIRLICNVQMIVRDADEWVWVNRLVAINADGTEFKLVSIRQGSNAQYVSRFGGNLIDLLPGDDGAVLLGRAHVPEEKIGSLISKMDEGYGVDRIDTRSLAAKTVVKPTRFATEYISDGLGTVRLMGITKTAADYDSGVLRYMYRPKGQNGWQAFGEYNYLTREGFNPYAVDPVTNAVYGFEKIDGRSALYKVELGNDLVKTQISRHPDVDIDGLLMLGRKKRIVGYSFATDKRQAVYFDPELEKLAASLSAALPNAEMVSFGGMSADEQKLIVRTGSDTNPGQFYLFDKVTKKLGPLFASRPELAGTPLAPVKPVSVKAGDGTMIPAYLTLPVGGSGKGLPAIVMPHGGPSARDEWGFDWLAQYFANQGFAVLQPNYRGSSGYGDAWYQQNGFKSWKSAISDVADSGRWLVAEGIAAPDRLAILGWSYGGYAALQAGVMDPGLFKAIVAIAPVTDFGKLKEEYRGYTNFRVAREYIGSGPHIVEGSPARNAAKITAPVLLFHGDVDLNVDVSQSQFMADQLRDAGKAPELVIYKKRDHYLEDGAIRADMLAKSSAFLKAKLLIK